MKASDIRIDIFRATSFINDTSKGVRMTHSPTGCVATKVDGSLEENKAKCLKALSILVGEEIEHNCSISYCNLSKDELWHLLCPEHWEMVPEVERKILFNLYKSEMDSKNHKSYIHYILNKFETNPHLEIKEKKNESI